MEKTKKLYAEPVLLCMAKSPQGLSCGDIAQQTGHTMCEVLAVLWKLQDRFIVKVERGQWTLE